MGNRDYVVKIVTKNGDKKIVTIPKHSTIEVGDYVLIKKFSADMEVVVS